MEEADPSLAQGVDNYPVFGIRARSFLRSVVSRPLLLERSFLAAWRLTNGVPCAPGVEARTLEKDVTCRPPSSASSSSPFPSSSSLLRE